MCLGDKCIKNLHSLDKMINLFMMSDLLLCYIQFTLKSCLIGSQSIGDK